MGCASRAMVCVRDQILVASIGQDGQVQFWNPVTGAKHKTLRAHDHWISNLAFSADASTMATAAHDQKSAVEIKLWNVAGEKEINRFKTEGTSFGLALSANGKVLAAADREAPGAILLWYTGVSSR